MSYEDELARATAQREADREARMEKERINRLQYSIKSIEKTRARAQAHRRVRMLITSGSTYEGVHDVGVKGKQWTFWSRMRKDRGLDAPRGEVVLTDEERVALAEWLQVRERELTREADALELKIAKEGV